MADIGGRRPPGPWRWRHWRVGAAALILLFCWACGGEAPVEAPDGPRGVLWISVANLRAEALLDQEWSGLLPDAAQWERAYAPSSLEVQSVASLHVGRLPTRAGTVGVAESQPPPASTPLFARLRRQGWGTGWVAAADWAGREGFTRGVDLVDVPSEGERGPDEVATAALAALDAMGSDAPWLLAVHFAVPYSADSAGDAGAVAATLGQVRRLTEATAARDDLLVILHGSNGYELGEHGSRGAGFTVFEEVVRVPLWARWTGRVAAGRAAEPVSLLDVTATLAGLAGAEVDEGDFDGVPLFDSGGALASGRGAVMSEVVVREWAIARAVVGIERKYVHVVRDVPVADRGVVEAGLAEIQAAMLSGQAEVPALFGEAVREELYDLVVDPLERTSVLEDEAYRRELSAFRAALRRYRSACDATAHPPGEITERLEVDPDKLRELESLGYL